MIAALSPVAEMGEAGGYNVLGRVGHNEKRIT